MPYGAGTDTFATLKTRAGDQPSIDNDAPRVTTTPTTASAR